MADETIPVVTPNVEAQPVDPEIQRRKDEWKRQEDAELANYRRLTGRIAELLPQQIQYNPAATNYTLPLMSGDAGRAFSSSLARRMTNLPNTLVIEGHGSPNDPLPSHYPMNPLGHHGIYPGAGNTNEIVSQILERGNVVRGNAGHISTPAVRAEATTYGGLDMGEIARAMGGATNEVKRMVLLSCYRAGIDPNEIKRWFPNAEQIIASVPESSTTAGRLMPMFYPAPDPWMATNRYPVAEGTNRGSDYVLRNYQKGRTNEILQATDWIPQEWRPIPQRFYLPYAILHEFDEPEPK